MNDDDEVKAGSNPLRTDSDGDGLSDGDEVNTHLTDPTESDSDFDTISDDEELAIGTDPNVWDTDGGGVADGSEVVMGTDPLLGGDDVQDNDLDNDGIPNGVDGAEDFDGDGLPNEMDLDSDNDGIPDLIEAGGVDSNNDGMVDDATDANGDGMADVMETNPLPVPDTDNDDAPNFIDPDSDGDDIFDLIEAGGTDTDNDGAVDDFANDDADGNGLADSLTGDNALPITDSDGDNVPDFLQNDNDNDSTPTTDTTSGKIITGLSGNPLGCTLTQGPATGVDPTFPAILAMFAALGFMRRRKSIDKA